MSAEQHQDEKPTEEKPKKSKKKLLIIGLGIVSLIGGTGIPMLLMSGGNEEPIEQEVQEEQPEEKRLEVADLGLFVVNLSENSSFLKAHLMMEYDAALLDKQTMPPPGAEGGGKAHGGGASGGAEGEASGGGLHPHLAKHENQLRDVIIRILSSKKAGDVLTNEGKARLKEELIDGLNEALDLEEPPVVGILFTEFIIQ